MEEENKKTISSRTWATSLKPAWTSEQLEDFALKMKSTAIVFGITHDKDIDEATGELVEPHTHIYLEYETPRKLSTIANLFGVAENFIEAVKNKKGFIRYLTHLDDADKHQYPPFEVVGNGEVDYSQVIMGNNLSDKDIAQAIIEGRGLELLGIVSSSKLRTIQAFLHYDASNSLLSEMRAVRAQNAQLLEVFENVGNIANSFLVGATKSINELNSGMVLIARAIKQASAPTSTRRVK